MKSYSLRIDIKLFTYLDQLIAAREPGILRIAGAQVETDVDSAFGCPVVGLLMNRSFILPVLLKAGVLPSDCVYSPRELDGAERRPHSTISIY